jgi:large subunit ribosomal protein L5
MSMELIGTKALHDKFRTDYAKANHMNIMKVPKLKYVVLSAGCGKYHKDTAKVDYVLSDLEKIAAQKVVKDKAKKSISNFSIRDGMVVGMHTTLRAKKMYSFLDRLIMVAMPRMQDFQGLTVRSFDAQNNYNFGLQKQDMFPEVTADHLFGMNICIGIKSHSKTDSINLLKAIQMPFRDKAGG